MRFLNLKKAAAFGLLAGFGVGALAYNPISTYHYLADPAATADDEYFYIITDSDDPAAHNADGYNIKALYGFRSKDMQNWTDFGIIFEAKREMSSVNDVWASGVGIKNGTFYITFPDGGGGGVGLIKAPNINGPYTNAVNGKDKLVHNWGGGQVDCDGVAWCFDPGIFFDDDGTGWVTFGGGENDERPNTDNFTMYKLTDNVDGVVTSTRTRVKVNGLQTRKMLEASYIHKYKGNYYFSYSTGWQQGAPTIDYAMSTSVTGPYTWKGTILDDPNMNGRSINGNNNHHGIAEFKGHWYAVYHDRRIAKGHDGLEKIPASDGVPNPNEGYHRSVSVDEMFYNDDGTIKKVVFTNEGPKQIENFDPYEEYPALTSSKQKGITSRTDYTRGQPVTHILLPYASRDESWIRVSGVDFGAGATAFVVNAASNADGNKIEIRKGSPSGTLAGTCTLKNTGSLNTYAETSCYVSGLSGVVDYIFLSFKGKDNSMGIKTWMFEGSGTTPPTPQAPFKGVASSIPGKIEMEDFDIPGSGRGTDSYSDSDEENHGDSDYRKDAPSVDLYAKATGVIVGYNTEGEWLEYTVNVKEAGTYTMFAAVAAAGNTSSFKLSIGDKDITTAIAVPAATTGEENYDEYNKVSANVELEAGEQVLRFTVTGAWLDIDYINFVKGKDAVDSDPLGTDFIHQIAFEKVQNREAHIFDLKGKKLGTIHMNTKAEAATQLKAAGFNAGIYLVKMRGTKSFMVNTAK